MKYIPAIKLLVKLGAVFYCSHSGGKDSQVMYGLLNLLVPHDQLVVVHADLGEVEWDGVMEHIEATTFHPNNIVYGIRDFFAMVRLRGKFPAIQFRQCTSELKTKPIMQFIKRDMKARGAKLGVNCVGIRAEESTKRSEKKPISLCKDRMNIRTRTVITLYPIFDWLETQVFAFIKELGQQPHHAYSENKRLSCVFCIMGCKGDLEHGARKHPELARKIIALEREVGHTMFSRKKGAWSLAERIPLTPVFKNGVISTEVGSH